MKNKYRFIAYLIRWQLSTPILAICLSFLKFPIVINTIVANLIGGILFYWVDKYIFNKKEVENNVKDIKENIS